ncbi:MAG: ParB/Srx family N-terminal domain-containing protein [Defluviicoccus sp.]
MTSLRFCPEQIELMSLARLKPYTNNARTHSEDQIARIAASLVEYGFTSPLLIADDGEIVAGNGRLLATQHLGLGEVPVIRLSQLTPEQVRAYRIADNRLTELSEWNDELLAAELHALNAAGFDLDLTGFEGEDLARLLAPLDEGEGLAGDDVMPEPPADLEAGGRICHPNTAFRLTQSSRLRSPVSGCRPPARLPRSSSSS